jgi:hypothetical protein
VNPIASVGTVRSSRRQFLLAGSVAAGAALFLGGDMLKLPSGLETLADAPGLRIPVAFVEGSGTATSLAAALAGGGARAIPAAGLRSASAAIHAATVSVQGFASAVHASRDGAYRHVLVDALVPSPVRAGETLPYYAWTFRRDPAVSQSSVTRMRLAPASGLRVGVSLDAVRGAVADGSNVAGGSASTAAAPSTVVFSGRPRRDLPTFQSGVYLLGLEQGMWSRPVTLPALDSPAWESLPSVVMVVEPERDQ